MSLISARRCCTSSSASTRAVATSAAAMASARLCASMSACARCQARSAIASASANSFASKAAFRARSAFCLSLQASVSWLRRLRIEAARCCSHWSAILLSSAVHGGWLSLGLAPDKSLSASSAWARSCSSTTGAWKCFKRLLSTSSCPVRVGENAGCFSVPCMASTGGVSPSASSSSARARIMASCEESSISPCDCTRASSPATPKNSLVAECTRVPQLSSEP
mmetsp:Transcript_631/g.1742  ORF Transcript_631/g.1742 Transcript_631/m.1742 type:complete len:223 (+) Transcript_631:524-1192(+)